MTPINRLPSLLACLTADIPGDWTWTAMGGLDDTPTLTLRVATVEGFAHVVAQAEAWSDEPRAGDSHARIVADGWTVIVLPMTSATVALRELARVELADAQGAE